MKAYQGNQNTLRRPTPLPGGFAAQSVEEVFQSLSEKKGAK